MDGCGLGHDKQMKGINRQPKPNIMASAVKLPQYCGVENLFDIAGQKCDGTPASDAILTRTHLPRSLSFSTSAVKYSVICIISY